MAFSCVMCVGMLVNIMLRLKLWYSEHMPFKACFMVELEFSTADSRPTMLELIRFRGRERRINIPQEISTKYTWFGFLLLESSTGARVHNIEHKHGKDAEQINTEILQEWIKGRGKQPVSWSTLIEVLRDIELPSLASEIEAVKIQSPHFETSRM